MKEFRKSQMFSGSRYAPLALHVIIWFAGFFNDPMALNTEDFEMMT